MMIMRARAHGRRRRVRTAEVGEPSLLCPGYSHGVLGGPNSEHSAAAVSHVCHMIFPSLLKPPVSVTPRRTRVARRAGCGRPLVVPLRGGARRGGPSRRALGPGARGPRAPPPRIRVVENLVAGAVASGERRGSVRRCGVPRPGAAPERLSLVPFADRLAVRRASRPGPRATAGHAIHPRPPARSRAGRPCRRATGRVPARDASGERPRPSRIRSLTRTSVDGNTGPDTGPEPRH